MLPNLTNPNPTLEKPKSAHEHHIHSETRADESQPRGESHLSSMAKKAYDTITGNANQEEGEEEEYYDVDAGRNYNLLSKHHQHGSDSLSPHLSTKDNTGAAHHRSASDAVEVARVDETGASTTARPAKEGEVYANYTYTSMVDPVITSEDVAQSQRNVKNLERNQRLADQGAEPKSKKAHESSTPNQYEERPDVSKDSSTQKSSAQGIVLGSNTPFYDLNTSGKDATARKNAANAKDSHLEYQQGVLANAKSTETSTAAGSAANTHHTHASSHAAPHHDSAATTNENYGKYHIPGTKSEGVDTIPHDHDHGHGHEHQHNTSVGQQYAGDATNAAYGSASTTRDAASDNEIHVKDKFATQPLGAALTQLDNQGLSNKGQMEHIESNDVMKTRAVDELQSNKSASSTNQKTEASAGTGIVAGIIDYLGFNEEGEGNDKKQTVSHEHTEFTTNEVPGGFARGYNDVTTGENVRAIKSDILKTTPEKQANIPTTHSKSFDTYGEDSNVGASHSKFDGKPKLNTLAAGAAKPVDHVEDPTAPSLDVSHHNTDQYAHNLPKMISEDLTFQGGNMPADAIPVPPTKFDESLRTAPLNTQTHAKAPVTTNKDRLADAHTDSTPYRFVQDKPEDFRLTKKDAHALAADKSAEQPSEKFVSGSVNEPTESTPYRFVQNKPQDDRLTQKNASSLATDKFATEAATSTSATEIAGTESTPYRYVQNKPQDDRLTRKDASGLATDKDASLSHGHHSLESSDISAPFNVKKLSVNPNELNASQNTSTGFATTPSNLAHQGEHNHHKDHIGATGKVKVNDKLAGATTESTPYSYVHANEKDSRLTKLNANDLKLNKDQPSTNLSESAYSGEHKQTKSVNPIETSKPFISAKNIDSSKNVSGLRNENDASSTAAIIDPSDFNRRTTDKDTTYDSKDPYANYTDRYDDFYEGHDQDLTDARNKQKSNVEAGHTSKKVDASPVNHHKSNTSESSNQDSYLINRFNSAKHENEGAHANAKDAGEQHGVVGKVKKLFKKDSDHNLQHQHQQQQNYNQESALNDPAHRVEAIGAASAAAGAGAASTSGTANKNRDSSFGGVPTSPELKRQAVEAPNTHTQGTTKPHSSLIGGASSKNADKLLNTQQSRGAHNDEQFANFTTNDRTNVGDSNAAGTGTNHQFDSSKNHNSGSVAGSTLKANKTFDDDFKDTKTEPSYIATHPDIDTTTPSNAYNPNKALGFDPNTYAATGAIVGHTPHGNNVDTSKFKSLDSRGDKDVSNYNAKQATTLPQDNTHSLQKGSDVGDSTVKEVIHGEIPKKSLEKEGVDFKHSLKSMLPGENKSKNQKEEKTPEGKTIINERGTIYTETHQDMARPEYVNQEAKTYTLPKTSESNPVEQDTVEGFSEGELVDRHPADENLDAQQNHKKGLLNRIKDKITN